MRLSLFVFAAIAASTAAFAADAPVGGAVDAFQVSYASNLNIGDSVVNLTNAGTVSGADPPAVSAPMYIRSIPPRNSSRAVPAW